MRRRSVVLDCRLGYIKNPVQSHEVMQVKDGEELDGKSSTPRPFGKWTAFDIARGSIATLMAHP